MRHDCLMLVTDYGSSGGYVGVLHAVCFRIAPGVQVIDVDHAIPPLDVRLGALRLARTMPYMPPGVHVGVVDPGVGGDRRAVAIAAEGGRRVLVGPDNGLLIWAAEVCGGVEEAVVLDREEFWLTPRAATFDGRDLFVPVAAHLASGVPMAEVGSPIDPAALARLERSVTRLLGDGTVELEVLGVDGFGNLQLSGGPETVTAVGLSAGGAVQVGATTSQPGLAARFGRTFGDVGAGELVVFVDSDGCIALALNGGSAAALLGARAAPGSMIRLAALDR